MDIKQAISRARHDAEYARREARNYRNLGMSNSAELSERDADMLETLIDAAEKWIAVTIKNGRSNLT